MTAACLAWCEYGCSRFMGRFYLRIAEKLRRLILDGELEQPCACMVAEQLSVAYVAPQRVDALVAANIHHLEHARALGRRRREEARPKRVTAEGFGVQPKLRGVPLH